MRTLALSVPLLAAMFAAPASVLLGHVSDADPADLYLVFGGAQVLDILLTDPGVQEVGPARAPFSRLITTTPEIHASLVDRNYWTLPASTLAELCGIDL